MSAYPRRLRWHSYHHRDKRRSGAALAINGRYVGGVVRYGDGRGWSAWLVGCDVAPEVYRRRCDAKRAVECAAVDEEMRRAAVRGTEIV